VYWVFANFALVFVNIRWSKAWNLTYWSWISKTHLQLQSLRSFLCKKQVIIDSRNKLKLIVQLRCTHQMESKSQQGSKNWGARCPGPVEINFGPL